MATTKKHPFAELTAKELEAKIRDLKEESFALRLQKATGQLENTARIRTVRRDLARAMTFLNARQEA
ncbi:large subunit ribosomal protein L29 [Haloferula luteola]|uniref:Large ribosomal subunit protein uL29 n=1 Tax=Haloferula luteola TaxID=595692 RepID=A0A840V678_9BACT|nr:50S ribosomal protein L29 [Haloferula luteola]MBB5351134.1 large subunit ribosomal protein L29 [Haloferula luteola]